MNGVNDVVSQVGKIEAQSENDHGEHDGGESAGTLKPMSSAVSIAETAPGVVALNGAVRRGG